MALIAVTASSEGEAAPYIASLVAREGRALALTPKGFDGITTAMEGVSGLLLAGGDDVHPSYYGQEAEEGAGVESYPERDEMELALLRHALDQQIPVLGICRGMQLINVAFGGSLLQNIAGHRTTDTAEGAPTLRHPVYVSPGSKLGAIIGAGAIYRTNSMHHQAVKEAQRATSLLASAYHPEDGIIEALESPAHKWLIGVQCHIEREAEVPKSFLSLFDWLIRWSAQFETGDME